MSHPAAIHPNELFDLIAPIAICGAADLMYAKKAKAAWKKIAEIDPSIWATYGGPNPLKVLREALAEPELELSEIDLDDSDDFRAVDYHFARDAYDALFDELIAYHGDDKWEKDYDHWGAKGYKRPGTEFTVQTPNGPARTFELVGDSNGQYPWYEASADLIAKILKIEREHP